MATNPLHQDYTVAWLCALPCEMAAAEAMLDEKHSDLPTATEDDNTYVLGKVCSHNIVIACCRSGVYGTTSASTCAIQLQATFKSIRFFLLVGIGGGAPTSRIDIRLGDVVVSKPTRDFGGVVQYDYGKTVDGGAFERTGVLNKPQPVLLTALARLESAHRLAPSKIPALLSEMRERHPCMQRRSRYPGNDKDVLFQSEYEHCDPEKSCDICCDTSRHVFRTARPNCDPTIHYGLIASGNQVIKHARTRDRIARELGILCFEMEAAGVMDHFQCLVVRGICDYSDSHKNKQWQDYAAATAAAFAKELLSVVHPIQMIDAPLAQSDTSHYRDSLSYRGERTTTDMIPLEYDLAKLVRRMSDYDEKKVHRRLLQKRLVGTTQWFLDHPDFKAWFNDRDTSSLWCSGKIGSGKTMIATTAIEAAIYRGSENRSPTIFFYCESEIPRTLVHTYILSSMIKQLCEFLYLAAKPYPRDIASELLKFFGPDRIQPDWTDLAHIFTLLFDLVPESIYIIDGLDSMDRGYSNVLLKFLQSLFRRTRRSDGPRLLLFSRDQIPGYINIATFIPGIRRISTSDNVRRDIALYIDTSITDKTLYRSLTDNAMLLRQVKKKLLRESSEMFLWVYLLLEILWDTCHTDADIRTAMATLPRGLDEVYDRCINRITLRDSVAPKVLKWVSFAIRPLHIDELREAVSFGLQDTEWNAERMPQKDILIGCCANLVIVDHADGCVRFAHSSVKRYLEGRLAGKGQSNCDLEYPGAGGGSLECGELCITYLSFSDFSLQLTKTPVEPKVVPTPSPVSLAQQALFRHPHTSRLLSRLWPRSQKTTISFNVIRTHSTPDWTQYRFLNYAVTHWALHTKNITQESATWTKFVSLASSSNETWGFHPWASGGRSFDSRLHELFGWAVKEEHEPLLTIAMASRKSLQRICDLPLINECLPALHVASKVGNVKITRALLDFCTADIRDAHGYTALHYAASGGHTGICRLLLATDKIHVDCEPNSKCTPLWLAASNGHGEMVRLLAHNGATVDAVDNDHRTALSRATEIGHVSIAELLLDRGANPDARDIRATSPLLHAARNGNQELVSLLLDGGAYIEALDYGDNTALTLAAENGHAAVVQLLLDRGAQVNNANLAMKRPLLCAAREGHTMVVKVLLEWGARLAPGDLKSIALIKSAVRNGDEGAMKLLLERGFG